MSPNASDQTNDLHNQMPTNKPSKLRKWLTRLGVLMTIQGLTTLLFTWISPLAVTLDLIIEGCLLVVTVPLIVAWVRAYRRNATTREQVTAWQYQPDPETGQLVDQIKVIDSHVSKRVFEYHIRPVLQDNGEDRRDDEVHEATRMHWLFLWATGFWIPLLAAAILSAIAWGVALAFGVTFHAPVPKKSFINSLHFSTTLHNTSSTTFTTPTTIPDFSQFFHKNFQSHAFTIQWWIWLPLVALLWSLAIIKALKMAYPWYIFFYILTNWTLILLWSPPRPLVWRSRTSRGISLDKIQGTSEEEGGYWQSLLRVGKVSADTNLSEGEAKPFRDMWYMRHYTRFKLKLDKLRITAQDRVGRS